MTNQDQMRIKRFLEAMIDFHGSNRAGSMNDERLLEMTRSVGLGILAEDALDLLGTITFPDDKEEK